ncbi:ABC transporter ATP-binding protein [Leptospirillum ferrooxidans]|jgi:ABC-2 type transport system ATP-binding protein|uniref:Putative daunorubicin resistance ABC transporter ATP-binding subunit n=1 Tax=Leptospirillum ferrooxidans (strain C2-3) TaxID=1162668 RepID=I0IMB7_LEPFC|nr:ATP-binding cassette domain-containing protein [Leptospirillum ferrooxidans]BAM06416.1 putative daunorubicin resistance ABC transporter ATP-binding subunit [Leptospirillum ferrooxidans C2-3]
MIHVDKLRKDYLQKRKTITAVDSISFEVQKGEFFSLLGPNGAGKTTTISILSTILSPTSGHVFINGIDVQKDPHGVRQHIGVIFQDPSLDDRLSAQENMDFHGRLYGMKPSDRLQRSEILLKMVDLWDRRNSLIRTFSGGMKRRLEIARGLMHRPLLLILDEPTIGLDPKSRRDIWQYIHQARKEWAMTILLTTHYLEEADGADRVAIMNKGKIVAMDTPGILKSSLGPGLVTLEVLPENIDRVKTELDQLYGISRFTFETDSILKFQMPSTISSPSILLQSLPPVIAGFTIGTPTLDDVFISLTGDGDKINEE